MPALTTFGPPEQQPRPSTPEQARHLTNRYVATAALLALVCLLLTRPLPRPVVAAGGTHLETVRAEYGLMLDLYVKPLDPAGLLGAAWDSAIGLLRQRNIAVTTQRPSLPSDREQAFAAFTTAWNALATQAGSSIDFTEVAFAADDAMANSVSDDHTYFLTPDEYQADLESGGDPNASETGLGVVSTSRPPHVVLDVAPGSGADVAGIHPGDTITAVNGTDVQNLSGLDYRAKLAGDAGTMLTITVSRPGAGTMDLRAVIGPFHFPIFTAKVLSNGVGYMRLRSFPSPFAPLDNNETVVQQLDDALASFEAAGATMWVLDLRDDLGGFGAATWAFTGRFLADGRTEVDSDSRGHRAEDLVDGHPFPVQRPLAVLTNGLSASASEITASTLHDYGRAVLVGSTTAGGLGSALHFPLPDGAGVSVTISEVRGGRNEEQIDMVGIQPDIMAAQPSANDLAAGRDPGIDAAVAALSNQEPFSVSPSTDDTLDPNTLRDMLGPYEVTTPEVPTAPEVNTVHYFGDTVINRYNEWNNWEGPGRDANAARQLPQERGWQGALLEFFGENLGGPGLSVGIDLYATPDGAAAAMGVDFPDLLLSTEPPVQLGDQTVAYRGIWGNTGSLALAWRHGRVLFTVSLGTIPGEETFDPLVTLANAVESRYQASPLP